MGESTAMKCVKMFINRNGLGKHLLSHLDVAHVIK
jgi:hypothetical protein